MSAVYLQQFPSYSNHNCKKTPFSRTAAHIFVSPWDAPEAITHNVVWMEREFDAYKIVSQHVPVFNSFPVIRTASSKKSPFHVPQPTFLFQMTHSTPPLRGFPSEYRPPLWDGKTRMVSLPGGGKISKICLFVLT